MVRGGRCLFAIVLKKFYFPMAANTVNIVAHIRYSIQLSICDGKYESSVDTTFNF